jgi:fermentation-respiration switch protein FrsA (DUF1100 family)
MGHGGSGTKRLGLPKYAERFAAQGVAALAFDYRRFGESEGEPRQVIDVAAQHEDYRAAVRFVRGYPGVDPERVALWGTSLGGGHVLAVAAADPRLKAVVSQVPLIDGWHRGRNVRQRLNGDVAARTLAFIVAAVRDLLNARRGRPPTLCRSLPRVGRSRCSPSPKRHSLRALGGESVGWRNELAPRFFFALSRYRKGTAERLTMPVLMCLGDHDLQASSRYAARIASGMPNVQIRRYPVGHFDVYLDPLFDEISTTQADFLREHLCTPPLHGTR